MRKHCDASGLPFRSGALRNAAMKVFSLLVVAVALSGVSCERHKFDGPDGTRQLHEHGAAHGAGHGEPAAHGAPAAHGEAAH